MKGIIPPIVISIFVCALFGAACGVRSGNDNANSASNANSANASSANAANDNVEDLRSMMNVTFDPDEVTWRTSNAAEKGRRVVAVLRLTPADGKAIRSRLGTAPGSAATVSVEEWFPAELTTMADTTGESAIGGTAYPATEFYLEPFTKGNVVLIPDTDFIVVDLTER